MQGDPADHSSHIPIMHSMVLKLPSSEADKRPIRQCKADSNSFTQLSCSSEADKGTMRQCSGDSAEGPHEAGAAHDVQDVAHQHLPHRQGGHPLLPLF